MILTKEQCLSEELNPQSSAINLEDVHLKEAILYAMNLWGEQCFNAAREQEMPFKKVHQSETHSEWTSLKYPTFELFLQSINQK